MPWFRLPTVAAPAAVVPQANSPLVHCIGPCRIDVEHERLRFVTDGKARFSLDPHGLECLLVYGPVEIVPAALALLNERKVTVAWCSERGDFFRARFVPDASRETLTRLLHARSWDDPAFRLRTARDILREKFASLAAASERLRRTRDRSRTFEERLDKAAATLDKTANLDELRGIEGAVARGWFARWGEWVVPPWQFAGRTRRPPLDPVNALLSLGYTLLYQRTLAQVCARGLEPLLGSLHEFRPGRMSLACDLMEPFRATVDVWVAEGCRARRFRPDDFDPPAETDGAVRLTREGFVRVLADFERHWAEGNHRELLARRVREYVELLRSRSDRWAELKRWFLHSSDGPTGADAAL